MNQPNDNRDETVPTTQVAPISFAEYMGDLLQRTHRSLGVPSEVLCAGTMGTPVLRDDSTPPEKPNSGIPAPIDFDAYE